MNRPNTVFWAVAAVGAATALGVIVTAAELHGRRVAREAAAGPITAALRDWADLIEPSPDGLARIRARTLRRAA